MREVSPLCQLNGSAEIMKIVEKLPYKMRDSWRRLTYKLHCSGEDILFLDLCKFVQNQSEILNQPIFGNINVHKHGYTLNGPVVEQLGKGVRCLRTKTEDNNSIDDKYQKLCAREFEDPDSNSFGPSIEDQRWEAKVRSSLRRCSDGHFEVDLPFKEDSICFPSNKKQLFNRLMSSRKKLIANAIFYEEYNNFMEAMFAKKFAAEVLESELEFIPSKSWYLTHFGVYHKQKKKIRVVFDASLKYEGVALNDMLMQGPDLANNLVGILLRFREERIAFMADIEQMFYQVRIPSNQKEYQVIRETT